MIFNEFDKYDTVMIKKSQIIDDSKIKPNYYQLDGCKEVWDIEERILSDCEVFRNNPMVFKLWCSVFEYIFRCGMKGDTMKDIKKAITNLEKMVEVMERDNG